ncbi:MAG: hypothetical protein ACUVWP_03450 [bacterium]
MKSEIFHTDLYKTIELKIKDFINKYPDFLSEDTILSTKAAGDAIQHILEDNFEDILGQLSKDYSCIFARRSMADLAFTDKKDIYYVVDVKTHRLETKFNMPNLISVERLARFYEDDTNYYVILMVAYDVISNIHINVERVNFIPIEFLSWECLTIGNLGWGQIQISNANNIVVNNNYSRKKWMLELCDVLFEFYPREIEKIKNRIYYFKKIKIIWEEKRDIWK